MRKGSAPELGMQLSFSLYCAANRVARLHMPLLEPVGLTFTQYLVMLELYSRAPQTVGELGRRLDMDTGTTTPLLKRMEAANWITRRRDIADERRVLVEVTPHALSKREEVWAIAEKVEAALQLKHADLLTLRDTLRKF